MKLYVQLGKVGDILNILPLLAIESIRGKEKPGLMVAREFASILDGVGYVQPFIYEGPYHEVGKACEQAKTISADWVCTQVNCSTEQVTQYVYGPARLQHAVTTSFQKESWRVAGKLVEWDYQAALFFDGRDVRRETKLEDHYCPERFKGKTVLISLGGASSPFAYAEIVRQLVLEHCQDRKKWNVVDLAQVKAERVYDLLALYDKASCLIATDSAPLHLARATPDLPVLAFANDKPLLWRGSPWRPNHVFYCRYSDFPSRVGEFMQMIRASLFSGGKLIRSLLTPQIILVASQYNGSSIEGFDDDECLRWIMTPIERGSCGRDSANTLQDPERHPYLKDCLRMGMQRATLSDYVCLTRPDTKFRPGITEQLLKSPASFAYRMARKDRKETFQPVGDLFCARKDWWRTHLSTIPDLILGKDYYWSQVLVAIFQKNGGADITGAVFRE